VPDVPDVPDEIRDHYRDEISEGQRLTRGPGSLELVRTQEIIRRHLPLGPLRILDVGGAAGVHATWLGDDGHHVHVVDPMANHVAEARELATPQRHVTAEIGDARALPAASDSVDAVLLLGPLYHLTEPEDRFRALDEARRVLRPDGVAFVAGISRFASLIDGLSREFLFDPDFRRVVEQDLRDGQHRNPERRPHWFTTAYFHHPDELRQEAIAVGFTVVELLGVEGPAGWLRHLFDRWDDPAARETILFAARALEAEPSVLGASGHLLMVCRQPTP
jgi:SAM-dependent methyltransferase